MIGEFALATASMGHGQQLDHGAAGLALRQLVEKSLKSSAKRLSRKQLVAIDQVEQRHGLASQRVDNMTIVDHLIVLACARGMPTIKGGDMGAAHENIEP